MRAIPLLKLILVRHGETRLNRDNRIQGINDIPLSPAGLAQAHAAAGALARDLLFELVSSPLSRAVQTAQIISETLQVPFMTVEGLKEADAGELEGLTGQEMRQRYPEFARRWDEDSGTTEMPGGESMLQVQERAWCAITRLLERHPDGKVVAVTHNFASQAIMCKVLGLRLHDSRRLRQDLGSLTRLELTKDTGILVSLNETWHMHPSVEVEDAPGHG